MPTERARKRAQQDKKEGKAPSTQAGEYVREEMRKMKRGGGRAKNPKQAIAIGLSEARRDGVALPDPPQKSTRKSGAKKTAAKKATARKSAAGRRASAKKSARRS